MGVLDSLIRRQRAAAEKATEIFMDEVLGEAARLAPLDEGTLRGSADRTTHRGAGMTTVEGGFSTVYAEVQHERLDYAHTNGQAKYLEEPFKRRANRYPAAIAAAVDAVTR